MCATYRAVFLVDSKFKGLEKGRDHLLRCLPFDRKIWLGRQKHNVSNLPVYCRIATCITVKSKKGTNASGTEKLVNGKQQSVWFVPMGMKRLPQNVLLNFQLDFRKMTLTFTVHPEFPKFSIKW